MIHRSPVVRCLCLALLCLCFAWTAGAQLTVPPDSGDPWPGASPIDGDPPDPFAGSLRYGYIIGTGRVAIDPNLVYTICVETSTLIVHSGQEDGVAAALTAIRREDGSWLLPSGNAVVPQIASEAIVWGAQPALDTPELAPIDAAQVALVMANANLACKSAVRKWKCRDKADNGKRLSCSGCFGRRLLEGPAAVTDCKWTGNQMDECEMNGRIVACKFTEYELDQCKGEPLQQGTKSIQQCNIQQ